MPELLDAYVIGQLSEAEALLPKVSAELQAARERAARIGPELGTLVGRMDETRAALAALVRQVEESALAVSEHNSRMASLHQEIAALRRRAGDIKTEMERVGPGAIYNRLRRDRAKLLVQIEDREKEIEQHKVAVERARLALGGAERAQVLEKDKNRVILAELDRLQAELPRPQLYLRLFELRAARAHCQLQLDREPKAWAASLRTAIELMLELHRELRAGKYRLDRNSDVVGGRAMASAEAIFGAAALGDYGLANELFLLTVDPGLKFDHIFNVFRVWTLGLYLGGHTAELAALLNRHRYAPGLRGGYVQVFLGLVGREARRVTSGLSAIAKSEWEVWQDPALVRGAGVVNLGAVALTRLARDAGLAVEVTASTVPSELVVARPRLGPARAKVG